MKIEIKDAIPTDFDIEARTNIRNVATDSIQPNNQVMITRNQLLVVAQPPINRDESREQVNLLREQTTF